jgi:co-chaperonin GroES (HSP10)
MKPLNHFIIELPKKFKDTIEVGGKTLYLASKFDEFANRFTSGTIVAIPERVDTGARIGDTLYFHHHVVMNPQLEIEKGKYIVMYDPSAAYANHAICYKNDSGIHMLGDWVLMEEIKKQEVESSVIILQQEEVRQNEGIIVYNNPKLEEEGVKVGDTVGYGKNADYEMEVEGRMLLRMLIHEVMYVKED